MDSIFVINGQVVGRIALRHYLTEKLKEFGGHIGYEVRPSVRRTGVATELLRLLCPVPSSCRTLSPTEPAHASGLPHWLLSLIHHLPVNHPVMTTARRGQVIELIQPSLAQRLHMMNFREANLSTNMTYFVRGILAPLLIP